MGQVARSRQPILIPDLLAIFRERLSSSSSFALSGVAPRRHVVEAGEGLRLPLPLGEGRGEG